MDKIILAGHRYAAIDLLRIFAAAAVVVYHHLFWISHQASTFPLAVQTGASYRYLGVQLFFMISGYVITLSAMGRTRTQFAYARFVRLWPAFVICLGITIIAQSASGHAPTVLTIISNLTMLPHVFGAPYVDGVYWSLMSEIFFYTAIAVLVISNGDFAQRLRIFAATWLAIAIAGEFIEFPKIKILLALNYAPYFAVGASIFLVRNIRHTVADLALLAVSTVLAATFAAMQSRVVGGEWWASGLIIVASASMLYASTVIQIGPKFSRAAFVLGGISYPLYLLHYEFGSILIDRARLSAPLSLSMLLTIVAVVAICYGVWRVEMPLRKRLTQATLTPRTASNRNAEPSSTNAVVQ
jgi:peptidoglycan/LPS O-acetylase OafA/YrhL